MLYETLIKKIEEFEKAACYSFKNKDNIILAFTHSSYANENKNSGLKSNERLEFLGDAILNMIISEHLYTNYSNLCEGELTKIRANIVCETSLMKCANNLKIGEYLLLGKGEEITGGRTRVSILSDAFEAVIGAIYLDGGLESARNFILTHMSQLIIDSVNGVNFLDYKTYLQEVIHKSGEKKITYCIVEEKGPDHNKTFISQVKISNEVMGTGKGRSKKEAEQNAAKSALCKSGEFYA